MSTTTNKIKIDHSQLFNTFSWWMCGGSYPVPVPIIDGEWNAARDVPMAQIITKTHLSVFDLHEGRHVGQKNTSNGA